MIDITTVLLAKKKAAMIGITKKSSPVVHSASLSGKLPNTLIPPLPKSMLDRFPELKAWEKSAAEKWDSLRQMISQHWSDTDTTLNAEKTTTKTVTIENPTSTENILILLTPARIVVSSVSAVIVGSGSLTWVIRSGRERNVGADVTDALTSTSGVSVASSGRIVEAGHFMWLEVTGAKTAVSSASFSVKFTE